MSSFSSGRFAVYKNTTDNKLKKKNVFFALKLCPCRTSLVYISSDNLTLCAALTTAQWYCTRLKKISDELKLFFYERDDFFYCFPQIWRQALNKKKKFR